MKTATDLREFSWKEYALAGCLIAIQIIGSRNRHVVCRSRSTARPWRSLDLIGQPCSPIALRPHSSWLVLFLSSEPHPLASRPNWISAFAADTINLTFTPTSATTTSLLRPTKTYKLIMASYLASIFGTEQDKVCDILLHQSSFNPPCFSYQDGPETFFLFQ